MFENCMKKLHYLSPTIKQLPVTYLGNKYFNKDDSEPCVTNKVPYHPSSLINSLRTSHYKKFKIENRILKY